MNNAKYIFIFVIVFIASIFLIFNAMNSNESDANDVIENDVKALTEQTMNGAQNLDSDYDYNELMLEFKKSPFLISDQKIVVKENIELDDSLLIKKRIIEKTLSSLSDDFAFPDDAKIVCDSSIDNGYIVTIEYPMDENTLGPDYSARVFLDSDYGFY